MNESMSVWALWLPHIEAVVIRLTVAIIILLIGWGVSVLAGRAVRKLAARSSRVDPTIVPMAHTVTVWAIRIIVLIAVLAKLGVQTASIIAMLGAAGLAVGLALQGTLQNIAAGIMLLALRPLRAGESVSVVGKADGTVEEVGLFLSRFRQADGTQITLPNSLVWGNPIVNLSRNGSRRIDVQVGILYGQDIAQALQAARSLIENHPLVLDSPAPAVFTGESRVSTVVIVVQAWARAADYGALLNDIRRDLPSRLQEAGFKMPDHAYGPAAGTQGA